MGHFCNIFAIKYGICYSDLFDKNYKRPLVAASFYSKAIAFCSHVLLFQQIGAALGDSLQLILRSVLSKLQQAESLAVIQVLC